MNRSGGGKIQEVKEFKYLGYRFQRNGGSETHVRETMKKSMIAIMQTWRLGQKRFKNNIERKMLLFNSLVKSVILYLRSRIWGWNEKVNLEKIQEKCIRWTVGSDFYTSIYLLLEETRAEVFRVRIEAGKRAVKYEEKAKYGQDEQNSGTMLEECSKIGERKA